MTPMTSLSGRAIAHPAGWQALTFDDCVADLPIRRESVQRNAYLSNGLYPVVDQGAEKIAGYTNDEAVVYGDECLPLIVFGDHTRTFKYVDFPFATGADGTKLIAANFRRVDSQFLHYALLNLRLPSRGYNRHFGLLKESSIAIPIDRREQQLVTSILATIERAVELEAERIVTLKELKATTMANLFRRGLSGARLKHTEIGKLPEGWDVVPLGTALRTTQYGLSVRGEKTGQVPILRMNCQQDGRVVFRDLQYVTLDPAVLKAFLLRDGDLLFNRTNSFELVGRTALFGGDYECVFASYLIRLQVVEGALSPSYLNHYLNLESVQRSIKSLATKGVSQSNISASRLKRFPVPKPPLREQDEIAKIIDSLCGRLEVAQQRAAALRHLFDSSLHQFMTGQLRVTPLLEQQPHANAQPG